MFKYKKIEFKTYPQVNGKILFYGFGKIKFGENVRINSSISSNPIGGNTQTIISVKSGAVLEIGNNCGISNATIVCHQNIIIGNFVKIGGNVKIYDTDFHSLDASARKFRKTDIATTKAITIKDFSFIGAHSILLKGITVGEASIIGAGSVVTKSIPDGEIWAGNPAKFIKKI